MAARTYPGISSEPLPPPRLIPILDSTKFDERCAVKIDRKSRKEGTCKTIIIDEIERGVIAEKSRGNLIPNQIGHQIGLSIQLVARYIAVGPAA